MNPDEPTDEDNPYGFSSPQQAHPDNPNAYGPAEPLPGITSGAPRYGQNTSQLGWQDKPENAPSIPAYGPRFVARLHTNRPPDYGIDPRMPVARSFRGFSSPKPSLSGTDPDTTEQFGTQRWRGPIGDQNI